MLEIDILLPECIGMDIGSDTLYHVHTNTLIEKSKIKSQYKQVATLLLIHTGGQTVARQTDDPSFHNKYCYPCYSYIRVPNPTNPILFNL